MKRTIRLRESEVRRMVSESIKRVLNENNYDPIDYELMAYLDQLGTDLSVLDANLIDAGFDGDLTPIRNAVDVLLDALSPYSQIHQKKQRRDFDRNSGNEGSGFGSDGIGYFS